MALLQKRHNHPQMAHVRVLVALSQYGELIAFILSSTDIVEDVFRTKLIKAEIFSWVLANLQYNKKSPQGLADLIAKILQHGNATNSDMVHQLILFQVTYVMGF